MESVCMTSGDDVRRRNRVRARAPSRGAVATTEATPCKRGQRVIEPTGVATRIPPRQLLLVSLLDRRVGIVQPANRFEASPAIYDRGGFAARVPGCGGTATR